MTATIWTRTRSHYDRTEKNKPLMPYGSVRLPVCLTCGGFVIPAFDNNMARCPACDESVHYVRSPEDRIHELQEEIRRS